jgi:hypothetical protein
MSGTEATAQAGQSGGRHGNFVAARVMIVIATLLSVVSLFAIWTNRQMLDAGNWSNTSTQLLQNKAVRTATAQYLTDQIYKNIDVQAELEKALPDQAQVLAGPASTELRSLAQNGIENLLGTAAVQDVWRAANKALATQVIDVVNEKNTGFLQYQGNNIQLDLRQAALEIGGKIGLKSEAEKIPQGAAAVTVFTAKEIGQVRSVARFLEAGAVIFPLLAALLYILVVAVSRGRRRRAVINCSASLIIASLIALATRGIAEGFFLNSLVPTGASRPPAEATWSIATGMLSSIATNTIMIAILVMLFSLLGGPYGWARTFRSWVAPWTNSRPEIAYGLAFAVFLLFLVWGPLPATRQWLGVLLFAGLTAAGVWGLRSMTLQEFPDASEEGAVERLSASWAEFRATVSTGLAKGAEGAKGAAMDIKDRASTPAPAAPSEQPTEQIRGATDDTQVNTVVQPAAQQVPLDALERLATLHASGALSDEEFAAAKAKLL